MRVAIIGAGFAGLSVAWYLITTGAVEVELFDAKGVGGGASGVAAGLLHPYVGEVGRRSLFAEQALQEAEALLASVQDPLLSDSPLAVRGIERWALSPEQRDLFISHGQTYHDIECLEGDRFWIRSGLTVDCPAYLAGLWRNIEARGGALVRRRVESLSELEDFDQIVVAAGGGVPSLAGVNPLPLSLTKGQVLLCSPPPQPHSLITKGYLAFLSPSRPCYIGSTYERRNVNDIPDREFAEQTLLPRLEKFIPFVRDLSVLECRAALRVVRKGHYFPILAKQQERVWIFTALGSRGLLYHALLGKTLARAVVHDDACLLEPYTQVCSL